MSKSRIKIMNAAPVATRAEMEELVGEITTLSAKRQNLLTQRSEEENRVRRLFADDLNDIGEKLDAKVARAQEWAVAHPEEFGKARSIPMAHGVVGFRLGNFTLKTIKGWTWDRVLEKLREMPRWADYIRTKQEVDKEKILADRGQIAGDELKLIGVQVSQGETFFVEPRLETTEARLQEAA